VSKRIGLTPLDPSRRGVIVLAAGLAIVAAFAVPAGLDDSGDPGSAAESAALERQVLLLAPAAVRAGRLPRSLVDPRTGLLKDGTIVTCRAHDRTLWSCALGPAGRTRTVLVRRGAAGGLNFDLSARGR
jgi:hypothetical protein